MSKKKKSIRGGHVTCPSCRRELTGEEELPPFCSPECAQEYQAFEDECLRSPDCKGVK